MVNNTSIEISENSKYLGVFIDSKLNFQKHLDTIERKLSRAVRILCKFKFVLSKEALLKLYHALVHPHLLYGVVASRSTFSTYLNKLISLQNKAIKVVGGGKYRENATSYYFKLNVLKLPDLYKFETAKMVYNFMHNNLPSSYQPPIILYILPVTEPIGYSAAYSIRASKLGIQSHLKSNACLNKHSKEN